MQIGASASLVTTYVGLGLLRGSVPRRSVHRCSMHSSGAKHAGLVGMGRLGSKGAGG